jgi:hypothetical protein
MKAFFLPLSFVCLFTVAQAQNTVTEEATESNTLLDQFKTLKNKSNTYQAYKVVEIYKLDSFWKNVKDTVNANEKELLQAQVEINGLQKQLQSLKQENELKEQEVQKSIYDISNITVLGIDMKKENYVILNFAVLILLLSVLGFTLYRYKKSKQVSDEKQDAFEVIDQEYNDYKKNARDREIKLKRELQTELNRAEELNQQLASFKKHAHKVS